jgi:pimeloyl-ACP methyl ester carboxylesterase
VSAGKALQILVDSAEEPTFTAETGLKSKYYDIIGFDPRGVGETTPGAFCFEDGPTSWSWALREKEDGIIGSSDAALGRLWGMNQALGTSCSHHSESGDDIKKFMTTASVARDMLEIVEKHAEWKSYETQRISDEIFKRAVERSRKTGYRALPSTPKYVPYIRGKASLQYWGVSYGSFLGNTFASMYPSRVGRLILDGVVDAEDYLQTLWYDNLNDTEKVMSSFYTYCAAAGFPACALASPNATAPDISIRLATIVRSLYHAPLPVPGDTPEVITYSDARRLIFSALYSPLAYFPLVAELMAAIERRDGSAFADLLTPTHSFSCAWNDSNALAIQSAAQYAILCSDGDTQTSMSPDDFASYVDDLESLSPSIGAIWAQIRLRCTAWDVRPLYRFRGPMGGKTSTPVLWIGNTADPVTPLGNAHKMAGLFEGSVVLTQESAGVSFEI